jgi:hypothetical protein
VFVFVLCGASLARAGSSLPVYPYCDCSDLTSLGHFTASGHVTFNTSSLTYGVSSGGIEIDGVAVYVFDSISVPAGTAIIGVGSRPLALLSKSFVQVDGVITVSGRSSILFNGGPFAGGAGGFAGGAGPAVAANGNGPGAGLRGTLNTHSGGGGAGFGGAGGNGGTSFTGVGGAGGPAYGDLSIALQGGSGGATGNTASGPGCVSGGGGGGGGVLVFGRSAINISATGVIQANGGHGNIGCNGSSGGGSGGGILVVSPLLNHFGIVEANGGWGGMGSCCGAGGGGGGGRITIAANVAGTGTYSVAGGPDNAAGEPPRAPTTVFHGTDGAPGVLVIDDSLFPDCMDITPPEVTVPASTTLEATSSAGASFTFTATANDNVDGALTPTCTEASGVFPFGATIVTCSATDGAGNEGSASFTITVVDTTPPAVSAPADITTEATGPSGASVSFSATAVDNIDGAIAALCTPPAGTFALGPTSVTCTATDAHGNDGSASFTVTVVDTTPPSVTVPASFSVPATTSSGAVVTFAASASDLVSVSLTPTCTPLSGSAFGLGATPVTCTATDGSGNGASATFTVTVVDATAPSITSVTPSRASLWPPNHKLVPVSISAIASDAVSATTCSISNATSSEPDNGLGDGDTIGDIQNVVGLSVLLRAERAGGGPGRVYTITVTCSDAAGNTSSANTTVSVKK